MTDVNEKAPEFTLDTDIGKFNLKDNLGKIIVLFFFPKADTSGCTKEAKSFSELQIQFDKLNTLIIGISRDDQRKQIKFKEKHGLTCILGSDLNNEVCTKYGVWVEKSMYGKKYMGIQRSTFLINRDGIISYKWEKVKIPGHAEDVLEKIKNL